MKTAMDILIFILLVLVCGFVYFIPSMLGKRKKNFGAILILNIFTGWTFVGWVAALVWAATTD